MSTLYQKGKKRIGKEKDIKDLRDLKKRGDFSRFSS
jgi:hypothetical protein